MKTFSSVTSSSDFLKLSNIADDNPLNMINNSSSTPYFVHWPYQDPPKYYPFWFEKIDYDSWKKYASFNWKFSYYMSIVYFIIIFTLKTWMNNRQPFKLKATLVLYNLLLGVFSFIAFVRTGQDLLEVLKLPDGFHKSLCFRIGLNPPAAFYSITFALSKYIELGDTVFIILRKQPLIFLQWYHHITSLILAWKLVPYSEPVFRWYGVMNFGVHSLMYPYFAVKVLNIKIPQLVSMLITTLQLLQMIVGVGINVYCVHILNKYGPESCARDATSIIWIGGVYASFMILFAHFFYNRYLSKKTKTM